MSNITDKQIIEAANSQREKRFSIVREIVEEACNEFLQFATNNGRTRWEVNSGLSKYIFEFEEYYIDNLRNIDISNLTPQTSEAGFILTLMAEKRINISIRHYLVTSRLILSV